jgi:hypothetical protein
MTTRADMFLSMLQADPTFLPTWKTFVAQWHDQELPIYLALSDLAAYLVQKLESEQTDRFEAVFGVVESWITSGDEYVREAAVVGLLEDLQNGSLYSSRNPSDLERWLMPETARAWKKVESFWSEGKPILND